MKVVVVVVVVVVVAAVVVVVVVYQKIGTYSTLIHGIGAIVPDARLEKRRCNRPCGSQK